MAGQVVQMDYAVVGEVSNGFGQAAQILRAVAQILSAEIEAFATLLSDASIGAALTLAPIAGPIGVGAVGGTVVLWVAIILYMRPIKQKTENLAKVCEEFQNDLARAIGDHKKGDVQGKRYFGEGVGR